MQENKKHRVQPNMQGVYYVEIGVYTTETETEVVEWGIFLISQVIDRLHKKA